MTPRRTVFDVAAAAAINGLDQISWSLVAAVLRDTAFDQSKIARA